MTESTLFTAGNTPNAPRSDLPDLLQALATDLRELDYTVDGVAGLRREIAKRPEVFVGVFTEKMLTYALGRGIEYYDMPAVRKIVRDAAADDFRWSSIILGIAKSAPFQMRSSEP